MKMSNIHESKRILADVHPEEHFVTKDGERIANLKEMKSALENMEDHVFDHHVDDEKNDFAAWVHGSVGDHELAAVMKAGKSKKAMLTAIRGRTFQLRKNLRSHWFKEKYGQWEILDFALGILVGIGISVIVVFF